jgi:hypothetical protein
VERWKRTGFVFFAAYVSVHNDVRLGRILMAVVDVREEVSVQLFSSYVPRYVLLFRKQHKKWDFIILDSVQ